MICITRRDIEKTACRKGNHHRDPSPGMSASNVPVTSISIAFPALLLPIAPFPSLTNVALSAVSLG